MRKISLLVMAGGLTLYLVAVISMLDVSKRPVFETVVQKPGSTASVLQPPAGVRIDPDDAKGLSIVSSDDKDIGRLTGVTEGSDGKARWITVETGGFLGLGTRVVMIPASSFSMEGGVIRVAYAAREIEQLPEQSDAR